MPRTPQPLRLALPLAFLLFTQPGGAEPSTYAGVAGATLMDSGVMIIDDQGPFARVEGFEFVRRPDGGITLLNTIHAKDGRYRVRGRFDYDRDWRASRAAGIGLYEGVAVNIQLETRGKAVAIEVKGDGIDLRPTASCDPDCFLNLSPSAVAMFVMTRRYDRAAGGEQLFRWAGQDLDQRRTLSGGFARLRYRGQRAVSRTGGETIDIRHYTFVETLPTPDGGQFSLDFDLWTDPEERPMGFRVLVPGGTPTGVIGFRQGYEDVRLQLLAGSMSPDSAASSGPQD